MKKEIGGYLELEESTGQEYYPELCGVNLGRTALLWLMEARNCKKIYLPTYLCDSVTGACEETKVEIEFYHMDEKLCPLLPEKKLPDGEWKSALAIMKKHQIVEYPGALRDLEDDTPIYIYSTINLYCSSALINELIEAYREENAEDEAGKEDIYTNFDE